MHNDQLLHNGSASLVDVEKETFVIDIKMYSANLAGKMTVVLCK